MHTEMLIRPSRYDLDEHSKQQLDFVREEYGSLSRFLTRKEGKSKTVSRFAAIYGRDRINSVTTTGKHK